MRSDIKSSPRYISELEFPNDSYQIRNLLNKLQFKIAVASNQPDISRGLLTKENNRLILEKISYFYKIPIENFFICPHDDNDYCNCRKPKPGLIKDALKKFNVNPEEVVLIGDSVKDIMASLNSSLKEALFVSNNLQSEDLNKVSFLNTQVFETTSEALIYLKAKYL